MPISPNRSVIIKRLEQVDTRLAWKPSMPDEPWPLMPMRSAPGKFRRSRTWKSGKGRPKGSRKSMQLLWSVRRRWAWFFPPRWTGKVCVRASHRIRDNRETRRPAPGTGHRSQMHQQLVRPALGASTIRSPSDLEKFHPRSTRRSPRHHRGLAAGRGVAAYMRRSNQPL